jgi:hypothetical protein
VNLATSPGACSPMGTSSLGRALATRFGTVAMLLWIIEACAISDLPRDIGFAQFRTVSGLNIYRSGHTVLRNRADYESFLSRYWHPAMGVQPPIPAPPSFAQWAIAITSIRDSACLTWRTDIGGISMQSAENHDTQVVMLPAAHPGSTCRQWGSRVEMMWIRQDYPFMVFSTSQLDTTLYEWVRYDLLRGPAKCYRWKLSGLDDRLTPVCE